MRWRNVRAKINGVHNPATTVQLGECPDCGCRAWYLILLPELTALHAQCSKCGSIFHCPDQGTEAPVATTTTQEPDDVDEVPFYPGAEGDRL